MIRPAPHLRQSPAIGLIGPAISFPVKGHRGTFSYSRGRTTFKRTNLVVVMLFPRRRGGRGRRCDVTERDNGKDFARSRPILRPERVQALSAMAFRMPMIFG